LKPACASNPWNAQKRWNILVGADKEGIMAEDEQSPRCPPQPRRRWKSRGLASQTRAGLMVARAKLVFDTRGVTRGLRGNNIVRLGE